MHICRDSDNNVCKVDEPDIVWFLGPCLRKRSGSGGGSVYLHKKGSGTCFGVKKKANVTL